MRSLNVIKVTCKVNFAWKDIGYFISRTQSEISNVFFGVFSKTAVILYLSKGAEVNLTYFVLFCRENA